MGALKFFYLLPKRQFLNIFGTLLVIMAAIKLKTFNSRPLPGVQRDLSCLPGTLWVTHHSALSGQPGALHQWQWCQSEAHRAAQNPVIASKSCFSSELLAVARGHPATHSSQLKGV